MAGKISYRGGGCVGCGGQVRTRGGGCVGCGVRSDPPVGHPVSQQDNGGEMYFTGLWLCVYGTVCVCVCVVGG